MPHLSILLNNSIKPPEHEGGLAAWIGDTDVKAPPGVTCVEFERMQVQLNFTSVPISPVVQAPETSAAESESLGDMLLDSPVETTAGKKFDGNILDQAVEGLKGLPSQVAGYFERLNTDLLDDQLLLKPPPTATTSNLIPRGNYPPMELSGRSERNDGPSKGRRKLPRKAVEVLDAWAATHRDNMYPTKEEKIQLIVKTGLSRSQLDSQLVWYRCQMKIKSTRDVRAEVEEEIMLGSTSANMVGWDGEEMMLDHETRFTRSEDCDGDELLFSQTSDVSSSLFLSQSSKSSTLSTNLSTGLDHQYTTRSDFEQFSVERIPWPMSSASPLRLADAAFRILMGAGTPRRNLRLSDVEIKDRPQLSMSTLVPSIFSPGFRNSMAGNSRLLPTISYAISVSLPQNVQTPSLKRKLLQLANMDQPRLASLEQEPGQPGTTQRPSSVLQSRLWEMIQRKIFDNSAGRKLWQHKVAGEEEADDDFKDIFEAIDGEELQSETGTGKVSSDEDMLFWDDDDDLLLEHKNTYWEVDWGGRAIERDIEDMLLDDEWSDNCRDGRDDMLLDDQNNEILECVDGGSSIVLLDESDNDWLDTIGGEDSALLLEESDNEEMLI
ncbi:hypothetical protein IFR05_001164 [Cadophora sp. M221]|nr:hypothetical protein IFR05_001164 [Cadophora sp. M221]